MKMSSSIAAWFSKSRPAASSHDRRAALKDGDTVTGTVRTLMPYGAFVDIGGVDGLLHISDISLARVAKPEDVLSVGQELTLRILKIDPETNKISLGLKQLEADPWTTAPERLLPGQRVNGTVTRLMDFGAFVEIEPGLEGLIHISEMSWAKKVRHPSDMLKQGDRVDAVILSVKPEEKRIALGLKQALADPWLEVERKFPVGFAGRRPHHQDHELRRLRPDRRRHRRPGPHQRDRRRPPHQSSPRRAARGPGVKALVLAIDPEKRQIKLSMKQLIPTSIDEYIAEHKVGDTVSGRVVEISPSGAIVELGEGIRAACRTARAATRLRRRLQPTAASAQSPAGAGSKPPRPTSRSSLRC